MEQGKVILFDGVCHLCSAVVRFVIRRDPTRRFRFAPLQSVVAQQWIQSSGIDQNSVVLMEQGHVYVKSAAVLRILRELRGVWPLYYLFVLIPAPLRDAAYDFVATHRRQWFGQLDACMVPTDEMRDRFLDEFQDHLK
ncbi:thiol-disulfide oxidoreductase DCC family protein [Alicyclobacillus fastidiosus]|uniref:DCC1-like thiol-disulfide oxidoreductase family protein n=1 Tax=Alicyclobacillus fastidiosus TaxID=392011 RepID=A0ABV5ADF7_9BACL|nr:DCC1-like thiol-disulfide oxidoreductase family protein [Alicyclobacillus fastidiosus]WEH08766.1 DCC1-like thiol-disulfide oxidoreductase family protein [Alicyclobacillus fastidiosus]